jgi:ribosomal protein S18 acetylase RimI-like enzyme
VSRGPAPVIRELRRSDRAPLKQLVEKTGVFSDAEVEIALELIDAVLDKPGQKDYCIAVSDDGGTPVGYYCLGPTPGTKGTFDLYWIAVTPARHGQGIGAMLDAHAEASIRSQGGQLIVAETSSTPRYDATRAFYRRRGYTEVAHIRDYYSPGDDLVVFGKYLVPLSGG